MDAYLFDLGFWASVHECPEVELLGPLLSSLVIAFVLKFILSGVVSIATTAFILSFLF